MPAEEVVAAPEDSPLVFLHNIKWNQALSYAKKILKDEYPEDIQVYLIAIDNTKLEVGISAEVAAAGDKVVGYIMKELNQYNSVANEI